MNRNPLSIPSLILFAIVATLGPLAAHGQAACESTSTSLCLNQGRFQVEATWRDASGAAGSARSLGEPSQVSGLFALSETDDDKLLVKVLNGCSVNGRVWVFAATPSDSEHTLTVTDTMTGERKSYFNPLGRRPNALADTAAFATCTTEDRNLPLVAFGASEQRSITRDSALRRAANQEVGPCLPGPTTLCLDDSRFRVEVDWATGSDSSGRGTAVASIGDSGVFSFFHRDNWEVLVSVLDRCESSDRFSIRAAAATNVRYDLRVTDTVTGLTKTYSNPLGQLAGAIEDPDAFATCDAVAEGGATVRFVSDRSVMLSADRAEAEIEVEVVDDDGEPIPGAEVTWASSAPALVAIEPLGQRRALVRAESATTGSVELAARFGGSQATATALITRPGPDTVLIDSSIVLDKTGRTAALLARSAESEALSPGQILVSGDRAGVLGRIETVETTAEGVAVGLSPVSLPAAFEQLEVRTRGESVQRSVRLSASDHTLTVEDSRGRVLARQVLDGVTCEADGKAVQIELEGADVTSTVSVTPEIDLVIDFFAVERFRAAVTGRMGLVATTGSLSIDGSAQGEATCSVDLPQLELPAIPISAFTFGLTVKPAAGVFSSASFDGPGLTITGPRATAEGVATGGIEYTPGGWRGVAERSWSGEAELAVAVELDTEVGFEAAAGPFVGLDAGIKVALGRGFLAVELADLRFAELRGSAELSVGFAAPVQPSDPGYVGPGWDLGLATRGALKAEVGGGQVEDLLEALDIPTAFDGQLELFELVAPIDRSPRPELIQATTETTSCTGLPEVRAGSGGEVAFVVLGDAAEGIGAVWGAPISEPLHELARGDYAPQIATGRADVSWTPAAGATGTHRFFPRLSVDTVSRAAAYGAGADVFQDVIVTSGEAGDGVPVIESVEPNPFRVTVNAPEKPVTIRFRDGDAGVESIRGERVASSGNINCIEDERSLDVAHLTEGEFTVPTQCTGSGNTTGSCLFALTLHDCQGNVSDPVTFEVICEPAGAASTVGEAEDGLALTFGPFTEGGPR